MDVLVDSSVLRCYFKVGFLLSRTSVGNMQICMIIGLRDVLKAESEDPGPPGKT